MHFRSEYEKTDVDIAGIGRVITNFFLGHSTVWECIILDYETNKELAKGYGTSESKAREDAKKTL